MPSFTAAGIAQSVRQFQAEKHERNLKRLAAATAERIMCNIEANQSALKSEIEHEVLAALREAMAASSVSPDADE